MGRFSVSGKLPGMRKTIDWTVYPVDANKPDERIIQSSHRIARVNLATGRATLSKHVSNSSFVDLVFRTTDVEVPAEMLEELKGKNTPSGPVNIMELARG